MRTVYDTVGNTHVKKQASTWLAWRSSLLPRSWGAPFPVAFADPEVRFSHTKRDSRFRRSETLYRIGRETPRIPTRPEQALQPYLLEPRERQLRMLCLIDPLALKLR